jgi:hypothetical protein
LRALALAGATATVGVVGEIAYPGIYLGAGILFAACAVLWVLAAEGCDRCEWMGLAVLAWGALSAVVVSGNAFSSKTTLGSWAAAWFVWVAVRRAGTSAGRQIRILLIGGSAFLVAGLVLEFLGRGEPRVAGLMTNPNLTVAAVATAAPLLFTLRLPRSLSIAGVAALALPLILTGSRAAAVAMVVLVAVLVPPSRFKRWVVGACAAVLVVAIGWRLVANPESLAWHRFQIWQAVVEMILDHPVWGIGAADLGDASGPYRVEHTGELGRWGHIIGSAESLPLGVLVRIGVPGGLLAAVWMATLIGRLDLRRAHAASLSAMAAVALFHDVLNEPAILWWWCVVLGLCSARRPLVAQRSVPVSDGIGSRGAKMGVALAVAGLSAWAWIQPTLVTSLMHLSGGDAELGAARLVRIEPWHPEPMRTELQGLLVRANWSWEEGSAALDWSRRLVTVCPGAAWAWQLRALVHTHLVTDFGVWPATVDAARASYRQALDLQPHLAAYAYRWALFERSLGNLPEARRLARRAVREEPMFARGWMLLARLALDEGRPRDAEQAFARVQAIVRTDPRRIHTPYQRALVEAPAWQLADLKREIRW